LIAVLAALRTDVIRLGPSSVALPAEPFRLTATWYRLADGDPAHDYYMFLVHVQNQVDSTSIVPYAIDVNISTRGGENLGGWLPVGGDHTRMESVGRYIDESPPRTINLELPAGFVNRDDGGWYFTWHVVGERGLASQPIFRDGVDFLLSIVRFQENATMDVHVDLLLTWYYANPFQAYPVASRPGAAVCHYVPVPGSEGSSPYSPCS